MDRRNQPAEFWGQSVAFWCRLWQVQFEQSLRFWATVAGRMPHQSASELAAEADSVKETATPARKPRANARPAERRAEPAEASLH